MCLRMWWEPHVFPCFSGEFLRLPRFSLLLPISSWKPLSALRSDVTWPWTSSLLSFGHKTNLFCTLDLTATLRMIREIPAQSWTLHITFQLFLFLEVFLPSMHINLSLAIEWGSRLWLLLPNFFGFPFLSFFSKPPAENSQIPVTLHYFHSLLHAFLSRPTPGPSAYFSQSTEWSRYFPRGREKQFSLRTVLDKNSSNSSKFFLTSSHFLQCRVISCPAIRYR